MKNGTKEKTKIAQKQRLYCFYLVYLGISFFLFFNLCVQICKKIGWVEYHNLLTLFSDHYMGISFLTFSIIAILWIGILLYSTKKEKYSQKLLFKTLLWFLFIVALTIVNAKIPYEDPFLHNMCFDCNCGPEGLCG